MMSKEIMKDVIMKDLVQAMKEKNRLKKGVLQLVKAGLEKAKKEKKEAFTTAEETQIIQREVKQTKDSLAEAKKYGREDLAAEANEKLKILSSYLPKQLDENQVKEKLIAIGVKHGMNMGQAMKMAMPVLAGKTENALISKMVKQLIS